ncbi:MULTISPECIES: hypothetical protein [unclassified Breznakia]|uniref:hypothetical protein n=1 Tax=unclassified Breznakia TaxID=2623764 RepID=UPI0024070023|nr:MULTISPECIES: hypothetical protein [unclassified Breznakia]MDF9837048.1 hypothetical protein [Breznakia sp. PFB2-8]MDF9858973.1 hypothetical protein [Breznakia sp. PH5-24]
MRKILIIVFFLSTLIGCDTTNNERIELRKKEFVFEFGLSYSYNKEDYIKADKEILEKTKVMINGIDLDEPRKDLNTTIEGWLELYPVKEYKGIATYKDQTLEFIVKIEDTTPPEFNNFQEEVEIKHGSDDHIENMFQASDYSEVKIIINIAGDEFDIQATDFANMEVGEYDIIVIAVDSYNNRIKKQSRIIVK